MPANAVPASTAMAVLSHASGGLTSAPGHPYPVACFLGGNGPGVDGLLALLVVSGEDCVSIFRRPACVTPPGPAVVRLGSGSQTLAGSARCGVV